MTAETGLASGSKAQGRGVRIVPAERDALVPLGRVATPEDMAAVVAFLLSQDARYVNGHDLVASGGGGILLGDLPGLSKITRS